MEKETLEEAAQRYTEEHKWEEQDPWLDFIEGAEWQAERSYSEEELKALLIKALTHNDYDLCGSLSTKDWEIRTANFEVWFEHNKK
jgi:hypothetical protein